MPINVLIRGTFNGNQVASPTAEVAAGAASALDASVGVRVSAEVAAATATAHDAAVSTGSGLRTITHGDQLLTTDVGPWALQGVARGSETLESLTGPGRGFWRFDTPDEFLPTDAWPSNGNDSNPSVLNDTALLGGVVTGSPVTIDGHSIAVGTRIVQFCDFPDGYDFYAQGTSLRVLFRGCRFRWSSGVGGAGIFNDSTATSSQQIMMHFCDIGLLSMDPPDGSSCLMHIKLLGGLNHRFLRNYNTRSSTFYQPNVQGCSFIENIITEFIFGYGESGVDGNFSTDVLHLNGISSEGGRTSLYILRNMILMQSPDGSTGSTGTAAGQVGYGTATSQTGYGNGTNPGRILGQTDCVALFTTNGSSNQSASGQLQVVDNLFGGGGVSLYAGNADSGAQGVVATGNRWTTRYWTNAGNVGAVTDQPAWGSNGNVQSDNLWADDHGTGGNGHTALADRQYPAGNGPRAGSSVI